MAEGGSTYSGLEKYRETAIAFDDLIVQVGRAIALAQEGMDLHQSDFQREVARAFQEGRLRRLDITPVNAYTMPETTLYLKIGLSMRYPEGSDVPSLSAVPLNATTTNQNDIDVEASTEVRLRFVSVPQAQEPPGPAPSSLSSEEVQEIVQRDERMAPMLEELSQSTVNIDYKEDSRLWIISYLDAREARMVVLVDDRTAEVVVVIDKKLPPAEADLTPIGPPEFERIEPSTGRRGEILTVHGDNFLTLAGQTILSVDGRPIPTIRLSMKTISFKLPGWVNQGSIEIITPLGSIEKTAAFTPLPTFESFEPNRGSFDALHQRGSWFSVYGHNLCHGCTIRFATGVESKSVQILSPGQMKVEVPEDAGSGPLTLLFDEFEQSLADVFFMLPRVDQVIPRQARVGEEVSLTGNSLEGVTEVVVGDTVVSR
ncbi:MAG: IPT/TIG domain-containing protein, partial [Desulfobacteraceae bacterium]|nr:IPT/TIG domain-containing protein [Desulfobacteraceae bacterium]